MHNMVEIESICSKDRKKIKKGYRFASLVTCLLLTLVLRSFVPWSSCYDSSIELLYDDGTAEAGYSPTLGLYTYAVRFHTPEENESYELTEVSYYIYGSPSSFKADIRNENATSVFSNIVTPSTTGWFSISLTEGLIVRGEFYVAMKYLTLYKPQLGADFNGPDGQSGESLYGFPAIPNINSLDYMIRAKIKPLLAEVPSSFGLRSDSSSVLLYLGHSTGVNISIASFDGFDSDVELAVVQTPSNVVASFSKPLIDPSEISTLMISTSYGAKRGVHSIIISGTCENMTAMQALELIVVGDDPFKISPVPTLDVYRGESVSADIVISEVGNDFHSPIDLSITYLPSGLAASLSKNPITPTEKSTITINVSSSAADGLQNLTVVGTSQNYTRSISIWLTVEVPPPLVWMQSWFWILLGGIAGIVASSSAVQHYYRRWKKAKAPLDFTYLTAASSLAELEQLRFLNKISEKDYARLKKEYERKLKGEV